MLVDAIRAESFRLSKNRTALFWSLMFVPIISVVIGAITNFVLKGSETRILGSTKMPPEVTLGGGKGEVDHYVVPVKPGRILFEMDGVSMEIAKEALRLAAHKLKVTTHFIIRD